MIRTKKMARISRTHYMFMCVCVRVEPINMYLPTATQVLSNTLAHGLRYNAKKSELLFLSRGVEQLEQCRRSLHVVVSSLECQNLNTLVRVVQFNKEVKRSFLKLIVKPSVFKNTCSLWLRYSMVALTTLRVKCDSAFRMLMGSQRHYSISGMIAKTFRLDFQPSCGVVSG